jgi:hypothetical protein
MSPCYLKTIMATQAQIEANRRNSQKSTGPATDAGKAASSLNALKTGIYAESLLIHGESAETLDDLAREYQTTCLPVGPREQAVVSTLIHSDWLLRRMRRIESLLWNEKAEQTERAKYKDYDPEYASLTSWYCAEDHFLRIQRRLTALDHAYRRALADLERLQAKRLASRPEPLPPEPAAPQIGFVSSPATVVAPCKVFNPDSRPPAARIFPAVVISPNQEHGGPQHAREIHGLSAIPPVRSSPVHPA